MVLVIAVGHVVPVPLPMRLSDRVARFAGDGSASSRRPVSGARPELNEEQSDTIAAFTPRGDS